MPTDKTSIAWSNLQQHQAQFGNTTIAGLFDQQDDRCQTMSCSAAGLTLDFSKNIATDKTLALLVALAEEQHLSDRIKELFGGEPVNFTEKRAALHGALRNPALLDENAANAVRSAHAQMDNFVRAVHDGTWRGYAGDQITDVVNIGIGGSDLGPFMVSEALTFFATGHVKVHFVSNIDSSDIYETLKNLDPKTTLFVIASKTFTTLETLTNATTAREWLLNSAGSDTAVRQHFVAVTSKIENATRFGISSDNIFPMWDWVGGRYSLWSSIGLPIALYVGMQNFRALLQGAQAMDDHFATTPLSENMPVIMALLGIWYSNFWDAHSHAIIPYDHYLRYFPKYLQQLDMESNGKSSNIHGLVEHHTGPIIWGEAGTNGQHSFHQLLHQGTRLVPVDFIVPLQSHHDIGEHHNYLFANCLSQSYALMSGKTLEQAKREFLDMGYSLEEADQLAHHKLMPGNRPSNILTFDLLTPENLGALIALYEHRVFVQSVIWGINAFDQWGVELGKKICKDIYGAINGTQEGSQFDPSTHALIARYRKNQSNEA